MRYGIVRSVCLGVAIDWPARTSTSQGVRRRCGSDSGAADATGNQSKGIAAARRAFICRGTG